MNKIEIMEKFKDIPIPSNYFSAAHSLKSTEDLIHIKIKINIKVSKVIYIISSFM